MTHTSIVLRLSKPDMANPEGVQVLSQGARWLSPGSGWLGIRSGKCRQLPDGLHLMDEAGEDTAAICSGLNFDLSQKDMTGAALYPHIGESGTWLVAATVD